jgi:hypothetical protein
MIQKQNKHIVTYHGRLGFCYRNDTETKQTQKQHSNKRNKPNKKQTYTQNKKQQQKNSKEKTRQIKSERATAIQQQIPHTCIGHHHCMFK